MILVTGFGPFLDVADNPTAALAASLHGRRVAGETIHGMVLPVAYDRGPMLAVAAAKRHDARLVLGFGVARGRKRVSIERLAVRACDPAHPDADGDRREWIGEGPERVYATIDVPRLARLLRAEESDDAGRYVCNAWLWHVARALPDRPVGFVHVPPAGIDPERVVAALGGLLKAEAAAR